MGLEAPKPRLFFPSKKYMEPIPRKDKPIIPKRLLEIKPVGLYREVRE